MKVRHQGEPVDDSWPRAWRLLIIALCTLILCSCRAPSVSPTGGLPLDSGGFSPVGPAAYATLPVEAFSGPIGEVTAAPPVGPPGMEQGIPLAYQPTGPWTPPGIGQPWPRDEYLRDGGDEGSPAGVTNEWEVRGLEPADTIVHYDTIDGQRVVAPTNRVDIYSPRFGAIRQVVGLAAREQHQYTSDVFVPAGLATPTDTQYVASRKQNIQAERQVGAKQLEQFRTRHGDGLVSGAIKAKGFADRTLPHETEKLIRDGVVESTDRAFLSKGALAAAAWAEKEAVKVLLDQKVAVAHTGVDAVEVVYTVGETPGVPKLRVVKVASTQVAEPGDEIDFTIRFDNVGTQVIGNVTIIDNLTTRLEFVPDSAQCSVDAEISTQPNEAGSLIVRCEIVDPVEGGQGGVLRFRCRVR